MRTSLPHVAPGMSGGDYIFRRGILPVFHQTKCEMIGKSLVMTGSSADISLEPTRGRRRRARHRRGGAAKNAGRMAGEQTKTKDSIHHSCARDPSAKYGDKLTAGQYGCNPTGVTSTLERRLEVLELARKHNFLILEGESSLQTCMTTR